jgi:AbrB family looped-hinge helix DNA binding protein
MQEQITTVTRKGQVTIPIEIRRALGIEEGDKVAFSLLEGADNAIIVRPVRSVTEMTYGRAAALSPLPPEARSVTLRELRERFEVGMAEEVVRSLSHPDE